MTVPFLRRAELPMKDAAAIASSLAVPISVPGTIGYVITGWHAAGLPSGTTGYVYWPAAPGLLIGIIAAAPIGTRISGALGDKRLAKAYVALLGVVPIVMIV